MRYLEFYSFFKNQIVFSLDEIRKYEEDFSRLNLVNRSKKGYIKHVIRGWYVFSDKKINEESLYIVANKIYNPSYVSLEMALSYYNLIPEGVFAITCVSTKKTQKFDTSIGVFSYRCIKPNLMFGYTLKKVGDTVYKIADIEKTVLDFFYFRSDLNTDKDFEDLRFDCYEFLQQADLKKFDYYLLQYTSKTFRLRINNFISYVKKNA